MISDFNFYIKYHSKKVNIKIDIFIKILNCISDDENEKNLKILLNAFIIRTVSNHCLKRGGKYVTEHF